MHHEPFKYMLKKWLSVKVKVTVMYRLYQKLKEVKIVIKKWNNEIFQDVRLRKETLQEKFRDLEYEIIR